MAETQKELEKKLLSLLLEFVIFAHKDKLEREGDYEYHPDEHVEPLSISFHEHTMLSFNGMEVTESGGTYWLRFKTTGKLEKELLKSGMPTTFTALLINEKFRSLMYIDEETNFKKILAVALFEEDNKKKKEQDKLLEAILNIEKLTLLSRIKFP